MSTLAVDHYMSSRAGFRLCRGGKDWLTNYDLPRTRWHQKAPYRYCRADDGDMDGYRSLRASIFTAHKTHMTVFGPGARWMKAQQHQPPLSDLTPLDWLDAGPAIRRTLGSLSHSWMYPTLTSILASQDKALVRLLWSQDRVDELRHWASTPRGKRIAKAARDRAEEEA